MKKTILSTVAALIPASTALLGGPSARGDEAPNIAGETVAQVAARTGYSETEIRERFVPVQAWGALGITPAPETIADTYVRGRFRRPPAPGVHPRVYFGPDDLPRIREHLKESQLARMQMELVRGRCLQISPREEDWMSVPYGQKQVDAVYDDYLAKGIRINRRMGYHGPWVGGWINDLAAGRDPAELAGKWHLNTPQAPGRQHMMHLLPYEALRCLIDNDEAGGKRLAAALVGICDRFAQHMDLYGPKQPNWQSVYQNLSSSAIGLTYDWAYVWMTVEQRAQMRDFIASITRGKSFIGLDHVPAFPGNTTNWIIIHMNLLPLILSIEGEEGYDEMVYRRCVEGMRKWVYVANGPQGAPFEGYMKSSYAPHWLIPLAKNGVDFIGTEYSKNVYRRYALHMMLPWGRQHVYETGIGLLRDVRAMKYAHPGDPVVDLLYGASVESLLRPDYQPTWTNIRTTYAPDWSHVFVCDDPIGLKDGTYDYDARFDEVTAMLRRDGEPLSYYSDFRGVMTARTSWDRDATFLFFEPRNVPGGHTWDSRNDFMLASQGRLWGNRPSDTEGSSDRRSVILIDGKGQGHQCPQGRTVAYVDTPGATFCVGDATWAYSYHTGGDTPVPVTPNDSRLTRSPLPWMDMPWAHLPGWSNGQKGGARHSFHTRHNPVEYAYRTVGLVRGEHPYVLLCDDIRKDGEPHLFTWLMQLPSDVWADLPEPGDGDVILRETDGDRRLLVRFLAGGPTTEDHARARATAQDASIEALLDMDAPAAPDRGPVAKLPIRLEDHRLLRGKPFEVVPASPERDGWDRRLVVETRAVVPGFCVLLFPFREGETLPVTEWRDDMKTLRVAVGRQTDTFSLKRLESGRRRITVIQ